MLIAPDVIDLADQLVFITVIDNTEREFSARIRRQRDYLQHIQRYRTDLGRLQLVVHKRSAQINLLVAVAIR